MDIDFTLTSIIDILALLQAIIIGVILIFNNADKKPTLFFGLFLLSFGLGSISVFIEDTGLNVKYPELLFIPTDSAFLSTACVYLYIKRLINTFKPRDYIVLLPAAIEIVLFSTLFSLDADYKKELYATLTESIIEFVYMMIVIIFNVYLVILSLITINRYRIKSENYYSYVIVKRLKWIKFALIYFLSVVSLMLSLAVIDEKITYIIFSITDLIFIYWAGIHGLRQYTIDIPDWLNNKSVEVNHDQIKIKDNKSDITDYEYVYNIIVNKIKSDDLYKNMTLNLGNLAEACSISARRVSEAINQCGKTNFNQFINEFRIGEAKRLLSDPQYDNLSVIGIGMESGFNSKASFYTQFKKSTGLTPIQYKNTNR